MADDEQFSLCWNNFNSNLSAGFHESLLRGDLVDVTLAAEGQLVKAHRLILSVCSPYFRKMFTQVPVNQHAFIFLKDVSHSALKDLIQFMYCGEVNVKQDALPAFISTAEALQIKGLTESGDSVPANQSPAKEEIQAAVPVVAAVPTSTPAITQRSKVQRNRAQSFKVDSEESGDDKVQIRASSSHHVSTQQQQSQATVAASTQKRTMQQRNVASHASKRTKLSVSASSEGMDTSDTVPTQVQTVQIVKQIPAQVIEPEYIELPIESINPKNEPDYTDEPTEIETVDAETEQEHKLSEHDQGEADDDGNYVEDEAYGEMTITKYDETYLTEGEDNVKPGASGFVDSYTSDGGTGTEQSTQVAKSSNAQRKADYRNNPDEFELPDPVLPGVSAIRSYRPVKKVGNTDVIHRILANTFIPTKEKQRHPPDDTKRPESASKTGPITSTAESPQDSSTIKQSIHLTETTVSGEIKKPRNTLVFAHLKTQEPVQMSLLPTLKGAAGVLCHGHHYEFHYTRYQHKVYRCAWHGSHRCPAQVVLHNKLFYIVDEKHTHSELAQLASDILGKTTLMQ